jgi:D-3-phosphoglycerate dehydrogenase
MKCLAIADLFINAAMMDAGLKALKDKGITVEVREWSHESIEKLQEDNLLVEQQGSKRWRCLPPCFRALRRLRS